MTNVTPIGPQSVNAHSVLIDLINSIPPNTEVYCVAILRTPEGNVETKHVMHGYPLGLVIAAFEQNRVANNMLNGSAHIPAPPVPS